MKKVIGVTGSIGSGKSYGMLIFEKICKEKQVNAIFLDVDDIRRNILDKEKINREQLNQKIYNNKNEMKEYKKFINPKIKSELKEQINKNNGIIFIEWALLIEDKLYDIVDSIIMFYCQEDIQIKRLEKIIKQKEQEKKEKYIKLVAKLDTLSPLKTLSRGYSIVEADNKIIKSVKELEKGKNIEIRLTDGKAKAQVI